jgi:hypothetical protein
LGTHVPPCRFHRLCVVVQTATTDTPEQQVDFTQQTLKNQETGLANQQKAICYSR